MKALIRIARNLILFTFLSCQAQPENTPDKAQPRHDRLPAVAGTFYPASPGELTRMLEGLFGTQVSAPGDQPLALIVPHAGYIYSGKVAASGYRQLPRDSHFERIFLIGSSHTMYFNGAAVYTGGDFITPLGKVRVDPLASELVKQQKLFSSDPTPHLKEHSLEVQLPFLQYWLNNDFTIVPIILGGEDKETFKKIAATLEPYFNGQNLFVISTDFSHYPEYSAAAACDRETADAILANAPETFLKTRNAVESRGTDNLVTAICGWSSIYTLLNITGKRADLEFRKILYQNSGDTPAGDKDRVVGYHSICIYGKNSSDHRAGFALSEDEKILLLRMARHAISEYLTNQRIPDTNLTAMSETLKIPAGAFVTLKAGGELRGCIGNFSTETPLYKVVQNMAVAAAVNDNRFQPVSRSELDGLEIEISVLTPMKKIADYKEIELGRHGVYIKKGANSGTFLPQVGSETGWTLEEFLGHCARDKAGIGWDGWKTADIYTYEALVFSEHQLIK